MPCSLGYVFFSTIATLLMGVNLYRIEPRKREIVIALYVMIVIGISMVITI
jgi:hypothetical protein